jgi:hypothetical protein
MDIYAANANPGEKPGNIDCGNSGGMRRDKSPSLWRLEKDFHLSLQKIYSFFQWQGFEKARR